MNFCSYFLLYWHCLILPLHSVSKLPTHVQQIEFEETVEPTNLVASRSLMLMQCPVSLYSSCDRPAHIRFHRIRSLRSPHNRTNPKRFHMCGRWGRKVPVAILLPIDFSSTRCGKKDKITIAHLAVFNLFEPHR